jgi:hypothetical protein
MFQCINKNVGGQKGWRLPAVAELASLMDPSVLSPGPTLPPGHPFLNVQAAAYWSASAVADVTTSAWFVNFGFTSVGFGGGNVSFDIKNNGHLLWCVRGPMQESVY